MTAEMPTEKIWMYKLCRIDGIYHYIYIYIWLYISEVNSRKFKNWDSGI